jgi:hypothetical protein
VQTTENVLLIPHRLSTLTGYVTNDIVTFWRKNGILKDDELLAGE